MKFIVSADDTGAAKEVICNRGTDTSKQDAIQPIAINNYFTEPSASLKTRIIHLLSFNYQYVITTRLGGQVSVYDMNEEEDEEESEEKYKLLHNFELPVGKDDKPIALAKVEILESVIVAFESSKIFLIHINDKFNFKPLEISIPEAKPISAFTVNPQAENIIAIGGKEFDLQVVQLFNTSINSTIFKKKNYEKEFVPKVVFKAKNVKNDHLDLRVPIWITNILFSKADKGYKLITSTRYGQVRLYDTTEGRKPRKDYQVTDKQIVTLSYANDEQSEIIITDTHSLMAKYSLTKIDEKGYKTNSASAGDIVKPVPKLLGKYTGGNTGATFGVQVYEDIVAFAGLDRYLRVFGVKSREILAKVYLGVEVTSLLVLDDEDEEDEETRKRKRDEQEEDEELWNELDTTKKQAI
ncbi:Ribosome biogenesis protein NSA1 [Candida viswanathii]|uniref:Ribosome biogenesis protein NSA1 n=1 Tax=Candida viswanathii TaxID=5486 RepID=A0A367XPI2_9ASCO|nr:Ribosome biogenesis protein NSA1 [Candida viswanathii]